MLAQARVLDQLMPLFLAPPGGVLGGDQEVAAIFVHVAEQVAAELAMDGGAVTTELVDDLGDQDLGVQKAEDGAACLKGEVAVGHGEGLRLASLWKGYQVALPVWIHLVIPDLSAKVIL